MHCCNRLVTYRGGAGLAREGGGAGPTVQASIQGAAGLARFDSFGLDRDSAFRSLNECGLYLLIQKSYPDPKINPNDPGPDPSPDPNPSPSPSSAVRSGVRGGESRQGPGVRAQGAGPLHSVWALHSVWIAPMLGGLNSNPNPNHNLTPFTLTSPPSP